MQTAYKGERITTAKYVAFSKKAEEEGFQKISLLHNGFSTSQNIRYTNHKAVIEEAGGTVSNVKPKYPLKPTQENLENDIKGEACEVNFRYPDCLKTTEIADNQIALLSFSYVMKTEQKHKFAFEQALIDINSNTLKSMPSKYFVCTSYGHTYTKAPKHRDFSLTDSNKFIVIELIYNT